MPAIRNLAILLAAMAGVGLLSLASCKTRNASRLATPQSSPSAEPDRPPLRAPSSVNRDTSTNEELSAPFTPSHVKTFDHIHFGPDGRVDWVAFNGGTFRIRSATLGHEQQGELLREVNVAPGTNDQPEATDPFATELHIRMPTMSSTRILRDPEKRVVELVSKAIGTAGDAVTMHEIQALNGNCAVFERDVSSNPPQEERISLNGDGTLSVYSTGATYPFELPSQGLDPFRWTRLDGLQRVRTLAMIYQQVDWDYKSPSEAHGYGVSYKVQVLGFVNGQSANLPIDRDSQRTVEGILRQAERNAVQIAQEEQNQRVNVSGGSRRN